VDLGENMCHPNNSSKCLLAFKNRSNLLFVSVMFFPEIVPCTFVVPIEFFL
jgi:hypothetical protein